MVDIGDNGQKQPVQVRYLHKDAWGSVDLITNAKGEVQERLSYSDFGKRRNPECSGLIALDTLIRDNLNSILRCYYESQTTVACWLQNAREHGGCWDNAVVERFFGSLKHDWIFKVHQPTRVFMKQDVAAYMRHDHLERLHSSNGDMSPINYASSLRKVSCWA